MKVFFPGVTDHPILADPKVRVSPLSLWPRDNIELGRVLLWRVFLSAPGATDSDRHRLSTPAAGSLTFSRGRWACQLRSGVLRQWCTR